MKNPYEDIRGMHRPVSRRGRMSGKDRAKIFAPFAALRGYEEAVEGQTVCRTDRIALSEAQQEALNETLCAVTKGDRLTATFFRTDPGPNGMGGWAEGRYETVTGLVRYFDGVLQTLRLELEDGSWRDISFGDLLSAQLWLC